MFFNEEEIKNEEVVAEEATVEETPAEVAEEAATEESTEEVKEEATEAQAEEAIEEVKEETKPASSKNTPHTSEAIAEEFLPGNFDPFARPVNPRFANRPQREQEFEERVLQIKRVIKVTKGGRRFKFSALVVVGDKKGRVGYGIGKHIEVPEAIKKAVRQARKNLTTVKITGAQATVPHNVIGHKGAARVMLKPAVEGKGIIASDVVRAVVELAGFRNIYSKNLGTNNPLNVVIATVEGLTQMRTGEEIANLKKEIVRKPRNNNNDRKPSNKKPQAPKKDEVKEGTKGE